jgi:hypothetical protein
MVTALRSNGPLARRSEADRRKQGTYLNRSVTDPAAAHARQHSESRRTFPTWSLVPLLRRARRGAIVPRQRNDGGQVRNALPAQNGPTTNRYVQKASRRVAAAMKHRELTIRFTARRCGYSSLSLRAWASAGRSHYYMRDSALDSLVSWMRISRLGEQRFR